MVYEDLLELVRQRKSSKRFKADPVPRETVEKIIEVARFSPSAANAQPWEFVIVEDAATKKRISKDLSAFSGIARKKDPTFYFPVAVQPYLWTAPVLIVVCGDRRLLDAFPAMADRNTLLFQSFAICIYAIQLAAASLGLATAWATTRGEPREKKIRELLGIPAVYTVDHIIPLGYPDEAKEKRSKTLRHVEKRARYRREMDDMIHYESYDMGKFRSDEDIHEFIWGKSVTRLPRS